MPRIVIGAIASALLLILAYPQIQWWPLAWIAFVPFLLVLNGKNYKASFGLGYLFGFLFFAGTLGWFVYVTYPGAFVLIAYLSLYVAIFGLAVCFAKPFSFFSRLILLPSCWVVLEYIRAHALSGFGWVLLGHSQCANTLLIQIADITGVYGVSFIVMMVNVLIAESIKHRATKTAGIVKAQVVVFSIIIVAFTYGFVSIWKAPAWPKSLVAVVQPNIPQAVKWEESLQPSIVGTTAQLTTGLKGLHADLIVWPETSLPGVMSEVPYLVGAIKLTAVKVEAPLLMGAITDEKGTYFNSAYLIEENGNIQGRYDKIHLVPFGEFLPLRPILGWINRYVPLEDFTAGKEYTILHTKQGHPFGVLICFEDTVSDLRRHFANAGAKFFVNMTNDAWFMDTKAPFIHLQAAIFGCVENKRSLVRAANTGFSGLIDPFGRILASVSDGQQKHTFISGRAWAEIPVVSQKTFYTKYGDVFTLLCLFAILFLSLWRRKNSL